MNGLRTEKEALKNYLRNTLEIIKVKEEYEQALRQELEVAQEETMKVQAENKILQDKLKKIEEETNIKIKMLNVLG